MTDPMREESTELLARLEESLFLLHDWLRRNGWAGYDPYDFQHWRSRFPSVICNHAPWRWPLSLVARIEQRHPGGIRRIFRFPKLIYPEAMGLFAESYAVMHELYGDPAYISLAKECAHWLLENSSLKSSGLGWGLPFDWNSIFLVPAGTMCGSTTAVCAAGFWKLFLVTGDNTFLDACVRIADAFVQELNIDRIDDRTVCFSYTPLDRWHIHNANLTTAAFLARVGARKGRADFLELASQAGRYALINQRDDGSLPYRALDQVARATNDHYHCGYEMRALHVLGLALGDPAYLDAVRRYYVFYESRFLGDDGAPWRNPNDPDIVDIHGCSEALLLHADLLDFIPGVRRRLIASARWTLENMQAPDGSFLYRILNRTRREVHLNIPFIRWGQARMMRGLTAAIASLKQSGGT